jgi:hypothetical protein
VTRTKKRRKQNKTEKMGGGQTEMNVWTWIKEAIGERENERASAGSVKATS